MSSGHQRITWRRNIAENFNRLSRVHERYRQTTDRQTDRQTTDRRQTTDGRTTTYSEHEHEFTFAKNRLRFDDVIFTREWRVFETQCIYRLKVIFIELTNRVVLRGRMMRVSDSTCYRRQTEAWQPSLT